MSSLYVSSDFFRELLTNLEGEIPRFIILNNEFILFRILGLEFDAEKNPAQKEKLASVAKCSFFLKQKWLSFLFLKKISSQCFPGVCFFKY
ncbi:MAG: hypothetical protein WAM00_05855 [Salegentibacter sp.]